MATAGRAIFFSGLTVLIGLSGLIMFDFMFLRSVGIAGVVVVFFSVLAALTLLPALLAIAGSHVERFAVIRRSPEDYHGHGFWARLSPSMNLMLMKMITTNPYINLQIDHLIQEYIKVYNRIILLITSLGA